MDCCTGTHNEKPWCLVNLHQCIHLFRSQEEEDPVWRACNGPGLLRLHVLNKSAWEKQTFLPPQDFKTSRVGQNWKGTRFNKSGDGLRKKNELGRNKNILWASKVVQQINMFDAKPEI